MMAGQVLAKISADTSGLKRGVSESQRLLQSLASTATKSGATAAQGFSATEKALQQLNKTAGSARSTFMGFAAATGVMNFFHRTVSAAKTAMIDFNSTLEQATIGFTTMLNSADAANRYLGQLKEFAARTPFQFSELVGASQRLMALGFSAQAVQPMLKAVGDTVSALGGTMDYQGQIIIRALGQMQAKGKVSAEEMMQLSEAGISAWQYLADHYNVTTAEMMDRTKKTVVDSGSAVTAIMEGMSRDFGGMMEAQSKTLNGAFSTVLDYTTQVVADATRPLYDKLRDGMLGLADVLSSPKFKEGATQAADWMNDQFSKAFKSIGKIIQAAQPAIQRFMGALNGSSGNAWNALSSTLGSVADALTNALPVAIDFAAALVELAPALGVPLIEAAVDALSMLTDVFNENESAVRILLSLMVAKKIMGWAQSFTTMTAGVIASARAHLVAATAARTHSVAMVELATATQRANAAHSIGFVGGVVPGLDAVNARIGASAAQGLTLAQKSTNALKSGLAGLASMFNPVTVGIGAIALGLAAWSANTTQVRQATDDLVAGITSGIDSLEGKYRALEDAKNSALPSDEDLAYSGGLLSDSGAWLKQMGNFYNPFGDDFGNAHSGSNSNAKAQEAILAEQQAVLDQYVLDQKESLNKSNEEALAWADNQILAYAKAKDGVGNSLDDMKAKQNEAFSSMADPMQNFADQSGISLDTMMQNMSDNTLALVRWQEGLMYLLQNGGADLAAYFANLGPMSAQAMSELIHGTPEQLEEFRRNMAREFALTGTDAADALDEGLSKIPDLAERAGIDMNAKLNEQIDEAMNAPLELSNEYKTQFAKIKTTAEEQIGKTFGELAITSDETKRHIDDLATAFGNVNPADLVGAGITPEALGIPAVMTAIAELALAGEDNPITIAAAAETALEDIGATQEQIDTLVETPAEIELQVEETKKDKAKKALDDMWNRLEDLSGGIWSVDVVLNVVSKIANSVIGLANQSNSTVGRMKEADGGILPDQARIQGPGTLVQWAEPETGGEAFIPLSSAKRSRALEVWRQVGHKFGMPNFADGGVLGGGAPAPWAFGGSGGGSATPAKSGGKSTSAFIPSLDLLKNMNQLGEFADANLIKVFEDYLAVLPKFSDEWMAVYNDMTSMQQKIADDAAKIAEEEAQRAQEALDHTREIQDNMYTFGATSSQEYLAILQGRLAGLEQFSDEWMAVWSQIQAVTSDLNAQIVADIMSGAIGAQEALALMQSGVEGLQDAMVNMMTNAYKVGDMSEDDYMAMLDSQLAGYTKYSDEWTNVTLEIMSIEERRAQEAQRAADEITRANEAAAREAEAAAREQERMWQEQQRAAEQYQRAWDNMQKSVANALKQSFDSIANPIKQATSLMAAFGSEAEISFDQVVGFYDHMTEATDRWMSALDSLSGMGLNDATFQELLKAGPSSLGFAESLMNMGQSGINYINEKQSGLDWKANQVGTQYMAEAIVQGNQVIVGDVTIEIPPEFLQNDYVDSNAVYGIIEGAMGELARQIRSGV